MIKTSYNIFEGNYIPGEKGFRLQLFEFVVSITYYFDITSITSNGNIKNSGKAKMFKILYLKSYQQNNRPKSAKKHWS